MRMRMLIRMFVACDCVGVPIRVQKAEIRIMIPSLNRIERQNEVFSRYLCFVLPLHNRVL
jgi:hypothetical protein